MLRRLIQIIAVILIGFAGPAWPEPVLPALFTVTGLSEGDSLNVRAGPSTGDAIVAALRDGEVVEVTARSGTGWARILQGEGDGWVSMRYLAANAAGTGAAPLYCGGTEPFWALTLSEDGHMTYSDPEHDPLQVSPDWRHELAGSASAGFSVGLDGYVAIFNRRDCSDGMSDRTYGWALDLVKTGAKGAYLQGCCRMLP